MNKLKNILELVANKINDLWFWWIIGSFVVIMFIAAGLKSAGINKKPEDEEDPPVI